MTIKLSWQSPSTLIPKKKYYALRICPKQAQADTLPQQIKRAPCLRGKAVKESQTLLWKLVEEVKATKGCQQLPSQNIKSCLEPPKTPPPAELPAELQVELQTIQQLHAGSVEQSAPPFEMEFTQMKQQSIGSTIPIRETIDFEKYVPFYYKLVLHSKPITGYMPSSMRSALWWKMLNLFA